MTSCAVVDTNVLLVANGAHDTATPPCIKACAAALAGIHTGRRKLVIDADWEIIKEYRHKLDVRRPGVGNAFLKWVLTNHMNSTRIEKVKIQPCTDARMYEEFPANPGLETFDPTDRKFVAVSCAHPKRPPVLQALDSKWIGWDTALSEEGVSVEHLCRSDAAVLYVKKLSDKKHKQP